MSVGKWSRWLIYIIAGLVIIGLVWAEVDSAGSLVEAHCQLDDGRVTDRLYLYTDGAAEFDFYGVKLGAGTPTPGDDIGCTLCLAGCEQPAAAPVLPTEDVAPQWVVSPSVQISAAELVRVDPTPVTTRQPFDPALERTVPDSEWREPPKYLWPGMEELLGVWQMVAAGMATLAIGFLVIRTMED